ncbi:MAG: anti-sigma factor [Pseudomonadota bacterium]
MTERDFSDETLMAFADGELSADKQKAVEEAIEKDERLANRVAGFIESRSMAQNALKPLLDEPVPADLKAKIEEMVGTETNVTALPRRHASTPVRRWAMPLAASLALVVGGLGGYLAGTSTTDQPAQVALDAVNQPEIITALNTASSGSETDLGASGLFRAIASYSDANNTLCREFEIDRVDRSTIVAVACRSDADWKYRFTVFAGQSNSGYAPASSLEALDAYLNAVGASEPMSVEAEAAALEAIRQ